MEHFHARYIPRVLYVKLYFFSLQGFDMRKLLESIRDLCLYTIASKQMTYNHAIFNVLQRLPLDTVKAIFTYGSRSSVAEQCEKGLKPVNPSFDKLIWAIMEELHSEGKSAFFDIFSILTEHTVTIETFYEASRTLDKLNSFLSPETQELEFPPEAVVEEERGNKAGSSKRKIAVCNDDEEGSKSSKNTKRVKSSKGAGKRSYQDQSETGQDCESSEEDDPFQKFSKKHKKKSFK